MLLTNIRVEQFSRIFDSASDIIEAFIGIAILVFTIIVMWKFYTKMERPGWNAIIPFYNTYILFKYANKKRLFWLYLLCDLLLIAVIGWAAWTVITPYASQSMSYENKLGMALALPFILALALIIAWAIDLGKKVVLLFGLMPLAERFGKPKVFGLGMAFVPIIFFAILAFDSTAIYTPLDNACSNDSQILT